MKSSDIPHILLGSSSRWFLGETFSFTIVYLHVPPSDGERESPSISVLKSQQHFLFSAFSFQGFVLGLGSVIRR